MTTSKSTNSITGRDGYIVAQALYQACLWQEKLKKEGSHFYEWSNHQDMKAVLMGHYAHFAAVFSLQDKAAGREPADMDDEKEIEDAPAA